MGTRCEMQQKDNAEVKIMGSNGCRKLSSRASFDSSYTGGRYRCVFFLWKRGNHLVNGDQLSLSHDTMWNFRLHWSVHCLSIWTCRFSSLLCLMFAKCQIPLHCILEFRLYDKIASLLYCFTGVTNRWFINSPYCLSGNSKGINLF